MEKYRYILECDLPPLANENEVQHIKCACEQDKARLGQSARSYTAYRWGIHESQLRGAIIAHINAKRRIFRKFTQDGTTRLLPSNLQANVSLDEDLDIYVEMILMQNQLIIINAHDHSDGKRLPQ